MRINKMLQQLKFLTVLWTLEHFTCIETLWICTNSKDIMLHPSTGSYYTVWQHNYPPVILILGQSCSFSPYSNSTLASDSHFFFLSALILMFLYQHKLPLYLYLVSPLEDQKFWKASASFLSLFFQLMPVFFILFSFLNHEIP